MTGTNRLAWVHCYGVSAA